MILAGQGVRLKCKDVTEFFVLNDVRLAQPTDQCKEPT